MNRHNLNIISAEKPYLIDAGVQNTSLKQGNKEK